MSDEGRLVAGRYRVQRRIGSGAMGVVWECVDERLHRTVAVKQLLLQPGLDPGEAEEARQRAMREGRIAARLQHAHAVSVYDVAEDEGQPVLVMEFLPSTSLASMMSEHGPLPPREVARIGAQVASALGAAHSAGVVHRDIKPGNILLGQDGTVKITDFGISRAQGDVAVTKTGMLAGTPAYLSPDVACGEEPTGASDVFSLGATLYAAIEGRPPFGQSENTLALLHAVAAGRVEHPQNSGPMSEPLMAMLQARVEDRPDMAQVREMLQAVADGQDVTSVPTSAAPIPPAMDPGSAAATSAPNLTPSPAVGQDGTSVAAGYPYDEDPYSEDAYPDATSYMGADTRGDAALTESPRRRKGPVLVSGIALAAAAVISVLVTSAFLGDQNGRTSVDPAGNEETSRQAPPPIAPDRTTIRRWTTVYPSDEKDNRQQEQQEQRPDNPNPTTQPQQPGNPTSGSDPTGGEPTGGTGDGGTGDGGTGDGGTGDGGTGDGGTGDGGTGDGGTGDGGTGDGGTGDGGTGDGGTGDGGTGDGGTGDGGTGDGGTGDGGTGDGGTGDGGETQPAGDGTTGGSSAEPSESQISAV
ncbi:serine/threonine-protein kinase [Haloactinomyces albus]|uniref:non-specific serine/threonine protein kinase n=1 Tax=Haloactinomyces albus TaxID=1352928 RepID=A0AAE3ZF02_9ACTN|nr:serine/threonine-protein kinase [Haloactinomyces albus]MDR7302570.1 serine/threonine protein kinase [Haloactinomyces albus]